MTSFPADNCFGSYDFDDESSLSYMGQAPGFDQTYYQYHLPGCNNAIAPVEECFYCSGNNVRGPSLSPPAQYTQLLPIIRERSPTPSRTYAQAAAQGLRIPHVTSPAALAASRQLRPHAPQQSQIQAAVRRPTVSSSAQRYNAAQAAHQRSYAQAAQQAQNVGPRRPQVSINQPMQSLVQQSITTVTSQPPSQGHGLYPGQGPPQSGYAGGQTYLEPPRYSATPQRPLNPAQIMLQTPMDSLDSLLLRPEYTDNPRNIDNLVQGTQRGSHRHPISTHSSGNSTPLTPASPDAMSIRSGSSHASRRRGSALRDPSLPHRCPRCEASFHKPEDLRRHCQRSHTVVGQRPHPCRAPGCHWAFIHPKDLRRHAECHHSDPSAPPPRFPCTWEGCSKSYNRADNLQRHINTFHEVDSGLGSSMSRTTSQSSYYTQANRN